MWLIRRKDFAQQNFIYETAGQLFLFYCFFNLNSGT